MASSPTIYDVSRLSGVSTATVSRTFSDPDRVKESTRRKVYDAAAVLNYSPNAIARAMARQRTDRIAYIICKKGATILDEFYAGICEGIMRAANRAEPGLMRLIAERGSARLFSDCPPVEGESIPPHSALTVTVGAAGKLSWEYIA